MTEEKIKALVAKLRKLVPARGEWTTLAESACGDAADALEGMLVKPAMTDEQKVAALQERALELTVEYAPKHEYTDPDDGTRCFSALGFARDILHVLEKETVEVWHRDRKVVIYADSVMRGWGPNIETEMSNAPRSLQTVQDAMDWLYKEQSKANTPIEKLIGDYEADGFDFGYVEGVERAALRHVATMPDSMVRALLYALATAKVQRKFFAPKGWRLVPEKMSAAMINAWSGGEMVSSDENAYRSHFQEGWTRVVDAAMNLKCVECYDTGYVADGNHCIACSVPADSNIEKLLAERDTAIDALHRIEALQSVMNSMLQDQDLSIERMAGAAYRDAIRIAKKALAKIAGEEMLGNEVIDHCWKMYQEGQGSADHTDKEVFAQTLQSFAKWLKEEK
jgi:hypothetical protein